MKYLISNKLSVKTILFPATLFFFSLSIFWVLETDYKLNLYCLFYIFMPIPIYIFFIKDFKMYNLAIAFLTTLWALSMQLLST
jgi:hypothetical protein